MQSLLAKNKIIITCAKYTSHLLAEEVKALGFPVNASNLLNVATEGSLTDCMKLNLHLRTAHRVLLLLQDFTAGNADELYEKIRQLPWEQYLPVRSYFSVSSFVRNDTIRDNRFANLKVKDAIVDKITSLYGKRPDSGPSQDKAVIFLHWKGEQANLYLDTSGESIARHGYRRVTVQAPMQESLAAALIQTTRWQPEQPFVNPMCGSGTLAIEAALLSIGKAPGLLRSNFGFMHVRGFQPGQWEQIRVKARQQTLESEQQFRAGGKSIIATDQDPKAIRAAQDNAKAAGVAHMIHFEVCDFRETPLPEIKGAHGSGSPVVIMNPPYGERLGEEKALEQTYQEIGNFFKQRCAGYRGYIFTGNLNLAKKVRLRTKRRIEFLNGKIESRLLEYELYASNR